MTIEPQPPSLPGPVPVLWCALFDTSSGDAGRERHHVESVCAAAFVWGPLFGLFVACNNGAGHWPARPPADPAHSPSRDAGDPGQSRSGRSSIVSYLEAATGVDQRHYRARPRRRSQCGNLFVGIVPSRRRPTLAMGCTPRGQPRCRHRGSNPSGEFLWVRHFGSGRRHRPCAWSAMRPANVILTGNFRRRSTFGGPGEHAWQDRLLPRQVFAGGAACVRQGDRQQRVRRPRRPRRRPDGNAYLTGIRHRLGIHPRRSTWGRPLSRTAPATALAGFDPGGGHLFRSELGGKVHVDYFN